MSELKQLSPHAIPSALEKAERYRLLNEPAEAESICLDVLEADPGNQHALIATARYHRPLQQRLRGERHSGEGNSWKNQRGLRARLLQRNFGRTPRQSPARARNAWVRSFGL